MLKDGDLHPAVISYFRGLGKNGIVELQTDWLTTYAQLTSL